MPGLATVASALNANDQAFARIAAVHPQIPNLPGPAARNAMVAEDALIKYARDEGGGTNWNPALHPRADVPPNPGWFATKGGPQHELNQDGSNLHDARRRFAETQDRSRRTDAGSTDDARETLLPGNPMDEPAAFADRFAPSNQPDGSSFWSDVWPAIRNWLQAASHVFMGFH
jgi:hypothetical protein